VIRAVLPRLRPGTYPFPLHRQSIVWLLHFSLQRLAYLPVWRHLLFAFSTLRWALLRALGARAAFDMDASSDVLILDGPLITLGRGSMIGGGCTIAGHIVEHGRLLLAPVVVGRGVQIANDVMVAPGVTIGDDAVVGPGSRIGAGASIGAFAYLGAECAVSPGIRIGAHAVVGHQVSIGPGVTLGEGAVIETGSRIPKDVAVGDGARWPPAVQQAGA
jgi:acetyltransferase-like isoleucine patch superfamily enzyme